MSVLIACDCCGERETEVGVGEADTTWTCRRCKRLQRGGRNLRGREKAAFASMCDAVISPYNVVEPEDANGMVVFGDNGIVDYGTSPRDLIVL